MPWGYGKASHRRDMSRQTELELTRCQVPYFDDAVPSTSREPLVPWLNSNGAHPAQVPRDDARELPLWMVRRFDGSRRLVQGEGLRERAVRCKRRWLRLRCWVNSCNYS